MPTLAADLGGTWLRAALVDDDGTVRERRVVPTPRAEPEALVELLRSYAGLAERAVVGVPGRVDHRAGVLQHAPNLDPAWQAATTEAGLSAALGIPVQLANDADIAAVGEAWFGAGRGYDDVVFVTLSTGVGAGIVLGRRLLHGRYSAGEIGHTVLDLSAWRRRPADAPPAPQGVDPHRAPHTVEQLASGTALGRASAPLTGAYVVERAQAGDPDAIEVLRPVLDAAAAAVRNLAWLFTPQAVVVGGGLGLAAPLVLDHLRAHLAAEGPPGLPSPIALRAATLGDSAGLAGAAAWREAFGR